MDHVTHEHEAWLEHLSDAQLIQIIDNMSVNATEAQAQYISALRMLLADRIGRRKFWTGRGNTMPSPLI